MDNLRYRLIFDPGKSKSCKKENSRKESFISSKIPNVGRELLRNTENIACFVKFANFLYFCIRAMSQSSARIYHNIENVQNL